MQRRKADKLGTIAAAEEHLKSYLKTNSLRDHALAAKMTELLIRDSCHCVILSRVDMI